MPGVTTTVTGPLILGRWQQPAALSRAGFASADPYPLQDVLFCATCDKPFFGTRLGDGTRAYYRADTPNHRTLAQAGLITRH